MSNFGYLYVTIGVFLLFFVLSLVWSHFRDSRRIYEYNEDGEMVPKTLLDKEPTPEAMQWPSYPNFPWMEWSERNNIGRDVLYLIETDQEIVLTAVWNYYHKAWFSPGGEEDLEEEYGKVVYYIPVLDHDGDLVIVRSTTEDSNE